MSDKDKVGADAGQDVDDGEAPSVVVVHDYDPVRPVPPRKKKAKADDDEGGE